jgi:Cu-Zn family superoxide dismutase
MPVTRRPVLAAAALGAAMTVAAGSALPAGAASGHAVAEGTFAAAADAANALTYDVAQVPVGARVTVRAVETGNHKTVVTLHAWGLLPNETYGAHAHHRPCGAAGTAAGAHYQNVEERPGDETTPSTNPVYANPDNEVWLDLVTDDAGNGRAQTVVDWPFRPRADGAARSVIMHINPTSTGQPGQPAPGNAGARLACVTVPF